jgi:hypothetical protein
MSYTYNRFFSTTVYGSFQNKKLTDPTGTTTISDASASFDGDIIVNNNKKLTISSIIYQGYEISSNYVTNAILDGILTNFLNKAYADSLYASISSLSSYLTTSSASSTYQPILTSSSDITTRNITGNDVTFNSIYGANINILGSLNASTGSVTGNNFYVTSPGTASLYISTKSSYTNNVK